MTKRKTIPPLDQLKAAWEAASPEERESFQHYQDYEFISGLPRATVLVKEDQLYLSNLWPARFWLPAHRPAGLRHHAYADELLFASRFNWVWERIPNEDRQLMLEYWRRDGTGPSPECRPLIQLLDDEDGRMLRYLATCSHFGCTLSFRASLTGPDR